MKTTMVATLIPANQNSNSPNEDTEIRLVAVISDMRMRESSQSGALTQCCRTFPPATASNPMTITQKYQYSQPTENPAQPPRPCGRSRRRSPWKGSRLPSRRACASRE